MKLGFQILILMVFCFSCKDEKVFDSSPSERNANHIGELRKKLVNAPYGWAVTYFPRTDSLLSSNIPLGRVINSFTFVNNRESVRGK